MSNIQIVHEIDPLRWKTFVDQNPDGNIFHTPEMFEVYARSKGHQPVLWAAIRPDGDVLALLPAVKLTILDGPFKRWTTRAVAYGSVLCEPSEQGRAALAALLQAYKKGMGREALFTEFRNLSDLHDLHPVLQEQEFVYEDHLNFLVDLTQPQDNLWRNISKRKRDTIRSSLHKGITVEEATNAEQLAVAYEFLQQVYSRVQVPLADASLFKAAFDVLTPHGMCQVLMARVGDQYTGALFLLSYHGRIFYWYIGADRSHSSYGPSEVLVWHAMEWGKAQGYELFDFGGGGKPDQQYGPRDFKSRFGGVQVNYGRQICKHSHLRLSVSEIGYQFYRRLSARRHTGKPVLVVSRDA